MAKEKGWEKGQDIVRTAYAILALQETRQNLMRLPSPASRQVCKQMSQNWKLSVSLLTASSLVYG